MDETYQMNWIEESDLDLTAHASYMWANYIETRDVNSSGREVRARKKEARPLAEDQMRLVLRLRELARKHEA